MSSQSNLHVLPPLYKSKKQKKRNKKSNTNYNQNKIDLNSLTDIYPLTENQRCFFELYDQGRKFINLHGVAGTGKTFTVLYKALEEVLDASSKYKKIIIVRTAVQSRDQGFLPGNIKEKMDAYTEPYRQICNNLFNRNDAWELLSKQNVIEFVSTSFLRGTTFDNCIVIFDELQNGNLSEINTVVTRLGRDSKIMFCGDFRQTDLRKKGDTTGILKFLDITSKMNCADMIEFGIDDIVRGPLVKEYIIASLED